MAQLSTQRINRDEPNLIVVCAAALSEPAVDSIAAQKLNTDKNYLAGFVCHAFSNAIATHSLCSMVLLHISIIVSLA